MDHNLGDDLNLDGSMGVDFGHSEDTVVSQADITLEDSGHEAGIAMDFENIEEQPMLMDTGSEEIIDFMGEQFTLQEYAEQEDHSNMTTSVSSNEHTIITSQANNIIQIEPLPQKITIKHEQALSKVATHKTEISPPRTKKNEKEAHTSAPRQVAIAPKPGPLAKSLTPAKQYAIAPKPLTVLTSKSSTLNNSFLKKVTLAGVMQGSNKGNTVLTQIGKQLVMMPAAGAQKLKLVTGGTSVPTVQYLRTTSGDQAQLIQAKTVSTQNKPVITKLILPGQPNLEVSSNSQSLLTKVAPVASTKAPTQIVAVQQKNMPFTLGNKVLLATPTKSGVKFTKKQQLIAFKSPEKAAQAAQGSTTKKVLITSNPTQNVILKTTAPPKAQVMKDGNVVLDNQRTQLHQINVPGKGIQYIRLITNSNPAPVKTKLQTQTINVPAKAFLLTDSKGNLIQMSSDKMMNNCQAQPLLVASAASSVTKVNTKPQRKLVRIGPLINKKVTTLADKPVQTSAMSRSSQSLLAPISPIPEVAQNTEDTEVQEEMDSKASLHAIVMRNEELEQEMQVNIKSEMQVNQSNMESNIEDMESNVHDELHSEMNMDADDSNIAEVEVDYKRDFVNYSDCDEVNDKSDCHELSGQEEHPLIVIPSNFIKETDNRSTSDVQSGHEDSQQMSSMMSMDAESMNAYQSPRTPQTASENEFMSTELGLRLRKACNCTKSQCLKLYCECFANGEFCNRCNCNNCHNNLENEERRQKAIRGCLDRNPNAFRPKIGKAKVGGPEMIRRHNKGCNCKRSGCLKNYCECYEAKIACTSICKCVGCRNVEETLERTRRRTPAMPSAVQALFRPPPLLPLKQPCSFITTEVVEAVCQCLLAAGGESGAGGGAAGGVGGGAGGADAVRDVIDEFARCLQDIISAAHHTSPLIMLDEDPA